MKEKYRSKNAGKIATYILSATLFALLMIGLLMPKAAATQPSQFVAKEFKLGIGEWYKIPGTGLEVSLNSIGYRYPVESQNPDSAIPVINSRTASFTICENFNPVGTCGIYAGIEHGDTIKHASAEGQTLLLTPYINDDGYVVFSYDVIGNNNPPVITGAGGPQKLKVGEKGKWTINAYDPDGNYLSYSVNWGELTIDYAAQSEKTSQNEAHESTFTHSYSNPGRYTVRFTVTDEQGASEESTMTVEVVGDSLKYPDLAVSEIRIKENVFTNKDAVLEIVLKNEGDATVNGYHIEYRYGDGTVDNIVSIEKISPGKKITVTTKHRYTSAGSYGFRATVYTPDDKNYANNEKMKTVNVKDLDYSSPKITNVDGPLYLAVGEKGTWKINAYDDDSDYLYYRVDWGMRDIYAAQEPQKAESVIQTSTFTNTYSQAGTYKVKFTVSDNEGNTAEKTINVKVGKKWIEPEPIDKKARLQELYRQLLKIIEEIISLQ